MASLQDLSNYELRRQRNIESNEDLLRYLNLQENIQLATGSSNLDHDSEGTTVSKKRCRKSPLPPPRPRSLRLQEREERLRGGSSLVKSLTPPDFLDKFELPSPKKPGRNTRVHFADQQIYGGLRRNSTQNANVTESPTVQLIELYALKSGIDQPSCNYALTCSACDEIYLSKNINQVKPYGGSQMINNTIDSLKYKMADYIHVDILYSSLFRGSKTTYIIIIILIISFWELYHGDECCQRSVSKILFYGVLTIILVNLVQMLFNKNTDLQDTQIDQEQRRR